MYYRRQQPLPSPNPDVTPDRGPTTDPNPGELGSHDVALGAPLASLGLVPARGNRAGGGTQIDIGARVGIMRNLEFTAGGRAHRLATGTFSHAAPGYDPKTGLLHISTASESGGSTIGSPGGTQGEPAMPPRVEGAGDTNDTSKGDKGPGRRRDTKTP